MEVRIEEFDGMVFAALIRATCSLRADVSVGCEVLGVFASYDFGEESTRIQFRRASGRRYQEA